MAENSLTFREFVDLHQVFSFMTGNESFQSLLIQLIRAGIIVFALFAKFLQVFGTSAISNQIDAIVSNFAFLFCFVFFFPSTNFLL